MNELTIRSQSRCFEGMVMYCSHFSQCCNINMNFAVYVPPQAKTQKVPILYYLSGLTCTDENFTIKAGAQRYAAQHGILLVIPDTSPRNTGIPGEDDVYNLGSGAGFYLNAIVEPWSQYYQMYSYVTQELPDVIQANFSVDATRQSIFGHSMGGHGALICALKNPEKYRSVSAFAPICAPIQDEWGQNAFSAYLGTDFALWQEYDATELVKKTQLSYPILIDQGMDDTYYIQKQLLPEVFADACQSVGQSLNLRFHAGYDHSYFMIATFIEDHFIHHAKALLS
ncbi:S-formylglutathione hydrolase [Aphanothece hegewaldii CCALA 016]|uniref:S-formylglutathione hydrolase n=1 Tax=Aphanothece hegewaldii CCALA 016 TaxID=2107694 RepID=A0A2T1LXX0_9CHRO|nr:S-formylglutathione hydrolase [Aphanothece hegewaldii]PSF37237.1 S-formylglutathione hydrolase [Aphanothece hegewaldii CCALA 016]